MSRLVSRAKRGDAAAFGMLYDEYVDRVYGFARARGYATHDAEDLTATVFLKAWESLDSYSDRGLPFSAWLFRIARNALIDEYRKSRRLPAPVEELDLDTEVFSPEETVVGRVDAERVRAAVRELTAEQASVIALRYWWDMSLKDTARALDRSENAVKALQHRATRALARLLREDDLDESD